MAYPGINTTGFNAAPNQAASVPFGPQSAGISFNVFERNFQLIKGSSGISTTVLGDLTKVVAFGNQSAGATFAESAVLSTIKAFGPQLVGIVFGESAQAYTSRQVEFGLAPAGLTFGEDVTAFALSMIPKAMASMQFAQSAALQRTRQLMGSAQISFNQSALSSSRGYLAGQSGINFDQNVGLTKVGLALGVSGIAFGQSANLTVYSRAYPQGQAQSGISFNSFCEIARMRRINMAALASIGINVAGDLTRLPGHVAGIEFSHLAILSAFVRKPFGDGNANALLEFSEIVTLYKRKHLAGSDSLAFDVEADLLNNPMTMDIITMIRPLNNREMLR